MQKLRIENKTQVPNEVIRALIQFTRPPGIKRFYVKLSYTKGWSYWRGHGGRCGITLRWRKTGIRFPRKHRTYQYGQLKGRRYYLATEMEMLIYLFAHELMHTRQGQKGGMHGRVWGARGRYSEIETESWAIKKLREWRKA